MLADLETLSAVVIRAADEELLPRFAQAERTHKPDGSLVTAADLSLQQRLQTELAAYWPEYRCLGEEMAEAAQHELLADPDGGLWCLDPLDGTSNFTVGLPFFAVSVALLWAGEPVLGIVYDPVRRECFTACRGHGAWLNGERLGNRIPVGPLVEAIALVDFKRLPRVLAEPLACTPPYRSQRSLGSIALDWAWLAAGRCHCYVHGKQRLWDYAAGSLILAEAGGRALTLSGESVCRAAIEPRSVVAALDSQLFDEWRYWLEACSLRSARR